jgi:uncharacterized membrane protein (DUF485 family)
MAMTAPEMLASREFRSTVRKRWTVSLALTVLLFLVYYGYILLIAADKPLMSTRIGEVTTLGIPVGVAVIVLSWALTAVYVVWANRVYDVEVRRLKDQLEH